MENIRHIDKSMMLKNILQEIKRVTGKNKVLDKVTQ